MGCFVRQVSRISVAPCLLRAFSKRNCRHISPLYQVNATIKVSKLKRVKFNNGANVYMLQRDLVIQTPAAAGDIFLSDYLRQDSRDASQYLTFWTQLTCTACVIVIVCYTTVSILSPCIELTQQLK